MADPTNARQRTLNSFFDRRASRSRSCRRSPTRRCRAAPPPAAAHAPPPTLTVALEPAAKRTLKAFLADGLLVKVAADRPLADVELRLFEVLAGGRLRPLGSAFKAEPTPKGANLRVEPTRFARTPSAPRAPAASSSKSTAPTAPA